MTTRPYYKVRAGLIPGLLGCLTVAVAVPGSDIQAQVRTAMDNVRRILERHGLTMSNVLSVTLCLQDIDELAKADQVPA